MNKGLQKLWFLAVFGVVMVSCATVSDEKGGVDGGETASNSFVQGISLSTVSSSSSMVKLVEAFDHEHNYRGYMRERRFVIRVKNIAYQKQVFVRQKLLNGVWINYPAAYKEAAGNGWETWECSLNSIYNNVGDMADEFVVGYTVNGQTYWDNNGGQNYRLAKNAGPLLGRDVMVSAVYLYSAGNGAVDVRNVGYSKVVEVVYTTNNWKTVMVAQASYGGSRIYYGYSSFDNPNQYGVERWYFFLPSFAGKEVKYAISYKVNGQTYWDNNEGLNYTAK